MDIKLSKNKYKEGYYFNEKDFVLLFIHCLNKNGIGECIGKEIIDKLYPYKFEEQYKPLFQTIMTKQYKKLDLHAGIEEVKAWGCVSWMSDNPNRLFITSDNWDEYIREIYSPMYIELMQQLVKDYLFRNSIEKQGKYKLTIYGLNPNSDYSLINGVYRGIGINWQIITDGTLVKNSYFENDLEDMIYCDDPQEKYDLIGLTNVRRRSVSIENASFVIEQGKTDINEGKTNLYTKTMDKDLLEKLADYSTRLYTPLRDDVQTTEKPYVYSLKI
ncbi:MAG: hypothetical protein RSB99_03055 [Bacilli bacterium]